MGSSQADGPSNTHLCAPLRLSLETTDRVKVSKEVQSRAVSTKLQAQELGGLQLLPILSGLTVLPNQPARMEEFKKTYLEVPLPGRVAG